jgi:hypothetical protein
VTLLGVVALTDCTTDAITGASIHVAAVFLASDALKDAR